MFFIILKAKKVDYFNLSYCIKLWPRSKDEFRMQCDQMLKIPQHKKKTLWFYTLKTTHFRKKAHTWGVTYDYLLLYLALVFSNLLPKGTDRHLMNLTTNLKIHILNLKNTTTKHLYFVVIRLNSIAVLHFRDHYMGLVWKTVLLEQG